MPSSTPVITTQAHLQQACKAPEGREILTPGKSSVEISLPEGQRVVVAGFLGGGLFVGGFVCLFWQRKHNPILLSIGALSMQPLLMSMGPS